MPNLLAYIVLLLWPLAAIVIKRKLPLDKAVICVFVVPYLFLPVGVGFDWPLVPAIQKSSMIGLTAFLLFMFGKKNIPKTPEGVVPKMLIYGLFLYPVGMILANRDILPIGARSLPSMHAWDWVAISFGNFTHIYIPFMMGVIFLNTKESQLNLLKITVFLGLVYTIFMLLEIRLSPIFNIKLYGYFPHSMLQQFRDGGYRPAVFLGHGLLVAVFHVIVTIMAFCLYKHKVKFVPKYPSLVLVYLVIVAVLCKTYAVLIYGVIFVPLVFFTDAKKQIKYCFYISILVFIFPFLRSGDYIPVRAIQTYVEGINEDRAQSFGFRLDNEDRLLEKANQRPIFGWGTWGRSRIYNMETGVDISVTDGVWIMDYGTSGWVGYVIKYGFFCYPIYLLFRRSKKYSNEDVEYTSCFVVIIALFLIDTIPNASVSQFTLLIAGGILGRGIGLEKKALS